MIIKHLKNDIYQVTDGYNIWFHGNLTDAHKWLMRNYILKFKEKK